jgi:hypothetical protein
MSTRFDELVRDAIAPLFKRHGFRKKGLSFGRRNADGWSIVQIQNFESSTRTAKRFAINVSVFSDRIHREVPRVGTLVVRPDSIPAEAACHLRRRLRELVPDGAAPDHYDVDEKTDIVELGTTLDGLLETHALPFLDALATDRGLHAYWSMHLPELRPGLYFAVLVRAFDTPDALEKLVAYLRTTVGSQATSFLDALDQLAPVRVRVKPDPVD